QYSAGQTFCYQFCELASSFFNLIFLDEKDVMKNRNAEKTVIKGLFRLIKIASMYTMSVLNSGGDEHRHCDLIKAGKICRLTYPVVSSQA
ncbi:TPA: hypothetical protein ACIBSJ_003374, partial [Salmonella enterica subsp. enterica serovar Mississippi]